MFDRFIALWKDDEGATMAEYALVITLIALAGIVAWTTLGGNIATKVGAAATELQ
jgi:Flp pilus assembly pilin Flp